MPICGVEQAPKVNATAAKRRRTKDFTVLIPRKWLVALVEATGRVNRIARRPAGRVGASPYDFVFARQVNRVTATAPNNMKIGVRKG